MPSPFETPRLVDIARAGYSTRRQREQSDAMMIFQRAVERQRPIMLKIVIEGRDQWRKIAKSVWGSFIPVEQVDAMYETFRAWAGKDPLQQLEAIERTKRFAPDPIRAARELAEEQRRAVQGA